MATLRPIFFRSGGRPAASPDGPAGGPAAGPSSSRSAKRSSSRALGWLLVCTLLATLMTGLLIAAEQYMLIGVLAVLSGLVPVVYVSIFGLEDRHGTLLAGAVCVTYVAQVAQLKGIPLGYVMEAAIFGLMLASLRRVGQTAMHDSALRWLIVLLMLYFAAGAASTLTGRSTRMAALWQLQYNLKLPLMFALGMLIAQTPALHQVLRRAAGLSWLLLLPMLAAEIAMPGQYYRMLSFVADIHTNPLLGFGIRLQGPFMHSGYLAMVAGVLSMIAAVQWMQGQGRQWLVLAGVYLFMVVLSGQRQEFLCVLVVYAMYFVLSGRQRLPWVAASALVVLVLAGFALAAMDHNPLQQLQLEWGAGRESQLSERAILTQKGLEVADRYAPLGSGLGTYGGAGAQKIDQSQFLDLGFMRYWWFRQGMFIVDTFWPSVVAESGYLGAGLLLAALLLMWGTLLCRAWRAEGEVRALLLVALGALTMVLANSPTSAVIGDPRGTLVFWLLTGCAWRHSVVNRATSAQPSRHNPDSRFLTVPSAS